MDSGPAFWILLVISILLLLAVIGLVILYHENLAERIRNVFRGSGFTEEDVTEEEIISMVNEGHEQGVLQASEALMIHNIFEFDDKEVKDIMTHRINIIGIDGELSFIDALAFMEENHKSRYPVYIEDLDHIIGVLHIKDAFSFVQKNEIFRTSIKDIPGLIRDVDLVPETLKINVLFKKMQSAKNHMSVVIDEYGQTSGVIAMEDILEEIVGNIEDEHDEARELFSVDEDGSFVMDGMTSLDEVVDLLKLPVEEDAFDTLNGLLISLLDKIPEEGEHCQVSAYGYDFQVLEVSEKMIRKVRIKPLAQEESE